jgi:hypothetical protein
VIQTKRKKKLYSFIWEAETELFKTDGVGIYPRKTNEGVYRFPFFVPGGRASENGL